MGKNAWRIALFVLIVGALASIYFNLTPQKHRYAIDGADPNYINVYNTLGAFRALAVAEPKCSVRITAPFENRNAAQVLYSLGVYFCKIDKVDFNPAVPHDDILKGAVDNGIVIHMAQGATNQGRIYNWNGQRVLGQADL